MLNLTSSDIISGMTPSNTAAVLTEARAAELSVEPYPYPLIQPFSVIIRTKAIAVNPFDWKLQRLAPIPMNYPVVLGFDVAGEVVQVGDGVMGLKTGDRVMAYVTRYMHKAK